MEVSPGRDCFDYYKQSRLSSVELGFLDSADLLTDAENDIYENSCNKSTIRGEFD